MTQLLESARHKLTLVALVLLAPACLSMPASAIVHSAAGAPLSAPSAKVTPRLMVVSEVPKGVALALHPDAPNADTAVFRLSARDAVATVILQRRQNGSWVDLQRLRTRQGALTDEYVFFVPHAGSNVVRLLSRADARHERAVSASVRIVGYEPPEGSMSSIEAARARTLAVYNAERRDVGLEPVTMRADLNAIAQRIIKRAYFARGPAIGAALSDGYVDFDDFGWPSSGYCGGGGDANLNPDGTEPDGWVGGLDDKILDPDVTHVAIGFYRPARHSEWRGVSYTFIAPTP